MSDVKFEQGDRVVTNVLVELGTTYPSGVEGHISEVVTDYMLFFTPDVADDRFYGQWAVTSDEVSKLEV